MAFFLKTCEQCGASLAKDAYFHTKSPFYKDGVLNLCKNCVVALLKQHPDDLVFADKLCQWADIPFNPSEWIQLYDTNKENTFSVYYNLYQSDTRTDINWLDYNEKWKQAKERGELDNVLDFFSAEKFKELQLKWGFNYDQEQINYLEQLLQGMMQTQNINGTLQMDQAIKLCKISLIIDEKIRAGEEFKDLLTNYDKLVKIADFTPKNVKNANDFDSAGEIFAYLEKTGWINKYYDGVDRDIVDKTMKNVQGWMRHLYVNETGIPEDIQRRVEALKTAKELEDQMDRGIEEELDQSDMEAYNIDEDFNPDIT
jgi:hypothetical protein